MMPWYWIVTLCLVLPLWLLQNVVHEAAHGITMKLGWGYDSRIWPFPSMRLGRFTFAHVTYWNTAESTPPDNLGRAIVAVMPKIVNTVLICLSQVVIFFVPPHVALPMLLVPWFNLFDFSTAAVSVFKSPNESDTWVFQKGTGVSINALRIAVLGWIVLAGAWNLWSTISVVSHL